MSTTLQLLDTPKKISLQSQSTQIRAALKDFERTFAVNNDGRKPSKDDIKADFDVASKYKEYNKIRDILSGKLDYSALAIAPRSPSRRRRHDRTDSGISCTPKKKDHNATPRKPTHFSEYDTYDSVKTASLKPVILHAIGPTPQRDGKVLGLFDLLSNSAHSSQPTPSTKKRKLDALIEDSPRKQGLGAVAQTPSRKMINNQGDLLEHLTGTPEATPETGHRKLSRTPVSAGRKFMLSQFFATPNTARFSTMDQTSSKEQTPLRNRVLGMTPENRSQSQPQQQALDTTPAYLRRTSSFKDRLLSASQTASTRPGLMSPPTIKAGPPTLRHFRSVRLFKDIDSRFSDIEEEDDDDEEYDDDLEALREMEDNEVNILIKDSQQQSVSQPTNSIDNSVQDLQPPQKIWKKKGQKRTTRRSVMRPTQAQSKDGPRFVAAGDSSEDEENVSQIEETQLNDKSHHRQTTTGNGLDDDDYMSPPSDVSDMEGNSTKATKKASNNKTASTTDKQKKTRTINPNAVTHMNFRTLKIKNKNSKAKGKGRFGRGRR